MHFILNVMGRYWRVLSKEIIISPLHYKKMFCQHVWVVRGSSETNWDAIVIVWVRDDGGLSQGSTSGGCKKYLH